MEWSVSRDGVCVVFASVGLVVAGDEHVDVLVLAAFFDFGALGECTFVGVGCGLFEDDREAAGPELACGDHVAFGSKQRDVR